MHFNAIWLHQISPLNVFKCYLVSKVRLLCLSLISAKGYPTQRPHQVTELPLAYQSTLCAALALSECSSEYNHELIPP